MEDFDGRHFTNKAVSWREVKTGDVVLEGNGPDFSYRTLTNVDGKYWEYFEDGYYHSTSPEFCYWLVYGQKNANGILLKIIND